MRRLTLTAFLLALALALGPHSGHGQDGAKEKLKARKELMKRKLELGQQLLGSLSLNDLAAASKQAQGLIKLRKDPNWRALKTDMYKALSEEFERAAEGISKAAKDKNLESAKLYYLGLTMTCFNCHAYVRDQKLDL